jgi:hypothetical protein
MLTFSAGVVAFAALYYFTLAMVYGLGFTIVL